MARTIYSSRLWSSGPTGSPGTVQGPSVPTGFVWDVRDILVLNNFAEPGSLIPTLSFTVNGNFTIYKTPMLATITGVLYQHEGRQILTPADSWFATSQTQGWSWTITGYQLTA